MFVSEKSIVRQIWGSSDTVLFIFAGAAAEFALNKAVDWLYFTGKLPADPIGRLFSTVRYAQWIVFADDQQALASIDAITAAHIGVEMDRGTSIPDWAYRDVLFMLIDYSIRAFELLQRPLTQPEKEDVFDVFYRVGDRMGIEHLPDSWRIYLDMRDQHLAEHLDYGPLTKDLYQQYKKHLGGARYSLLLQVQGLLVPQIVKKLMGLRPNAWFYPFLWGYKHLRTLSLSPLIKSILLPRAYLNQIKSLDRYGMDIAVEQGDRKNQ
jgi:hypothetical protein